MRRHTVRQRVQRPRWKKLEPLIKSYLGNALHVLTQMTDAGMITFTLRRLGASADLLGPFERVQRKMLKAVLQVFGGGDDADNAQLRVAAILLIRRMAVAVPESLDSCLRGVYRTYAANAKFTTAAGAPAISFMADCVVEMFGLDLTVSYQHMFVALRQLAVLLRSALTTKEKDAFRAVYCWQAVWCMEVWCRVLVTYADKEQLMPLVYPLVQIVLGAAKLLPAARYFPLRLRLVRLLNRLGGASGRFVPVSSLLLEVLQFKELNKAPMSEGKSRPPDFSTLLKVPKTVVRTPGFQNEVVFQAMELLAEHLAQWAYSPAFPELLHVPAAQLRVFAKATPVERFRKQARGLLDAAERHAEWVKAKRNAVDFAPKDQVGLKIRVVCISLVGAMLLRSDAWNAHTARPIGSHWAWITANPRIQIRTRRVVNTRRVQVVEPRGVYPHSTLDSRRICSTHVHALTSTARAAL
jgi:nucleolar complex protein 2